MFYPGFIWFLCSSNCHCCLCFPMRLCISNRHCCILGVALFVWVCFCTMEPHGIPLSGVLVHVVSVFIQLPLLPLLPHEALHQHPGSGFVCVGLFLYNGTTWNPLVWCFGPCGFCVHPTATAASASPSGSASAIGTAASWEWLCLCGFVSVQWNHMESPCLVFWSHLHSFTVYACIYCRIDTLQNPTG